MDGSHLTQPPKPRPVKIRLNLRDTMLSGEVSLASLTNEVKRRWQSSSISGYIASVNHRSLNPQSELYGQLQVTLRNGVTAPGNIEAELRTIAQKVVAEYSTAARRR